MPSIAKSDENDLRCATGTSGPLAQTKRKPTRKPSANQRANHFPKDVRSIQNGVQTILPAAHIILACRANHLACCANHFGLSRKPFLAWSYLGLPPIAKPPAPLSLP